MKLKFKCILMILLVNISSSYANSDTNLFSWSNGNVISNNAFIREYDQPSNSWLSSLETNLYHTYSVSSSNQIYNCNIQIRGTSNTEKHHCYDLFTITNSNGLILYQRYGEPLTTTRWLSSDENDNHYFRKISLDNDSYALIFAGWWFVTQSKEPGEMIIVVISKNVVTLVYDGPALAISSTDFDSNNFYMDYITDATGLTDPETGELRINSATLADCTKYRLYKDGNVLKIAQWVTGNEPSIP